MAKVIKVVDFNNHRYTFENTFYNTGSMSHDILTMTDENGNEYRGEVTWINRPYHRFDLEEAFTEIVSKAFGPKAKELILNINKSAYSVEDAIDKFFSQFNPNDIEDNPVTEYDSSEDARRTSLANYLEVEVDEVESIGDNEFEVNGETYKVLTDEEADDEFENNVRNLWDEGGLDYLPDYLQDSIIEHCVDDDELEDEVRSLIEDEVNDRSDGDIVSDCVDEDIIEYEDAYDENDELLDTVDIDDLREKLIDYRVEELNGDYVGYLTDMGFDQEYFKNLIDEDKAVEALKDNILANSSRGQEIAYYDGDEIELDNNLFAYRTN